MRASASAALLSVVLGAGLLASCRVGPGFAVEVSIRAGEDLGDEVVRAVRTLEIHVDGSETFDARYPIGDQLAGQVGRWLYVPSAGATEASFVVRGLDANEVVVADGTSAVVALRPGGRSQVEVVLGPPSLVPADLGTGDSAVHGHVDLGGPDLLVPLTLAFGAVGYKPVPTNTYPAAWVAVGAVDNDAFPDLVVASRGQSSAYFFGGHGDGTFEDAAAVGTTSDAASLALARLDGDGRLDLVMLDVGNQQVVVYLADPTTGALGNAGSYAVGVSPTKVATGDVDGDLDVDLVVVNQGADSVSVLLNDGTGHFASKVDYGAGTGPVGVAMGDLLGDGKPEIVVANPASDNVTVLINDGSGAFGSSFPISTAPQPRAVAIGDLDGDKQADLAVACTTQPGVLGLLFNQGAGIFAPRQDHPLGNAPTAIAIGDLDHDGYADIASNAEASSTLDVRLGREGFAGVHAFTVGSFTKHVALADVNADGLLDIAVAGNNGAGVLLNTSFR